MHGRRRICKPTKCRPQRVVLTSQPPVIDRNRLRRQPPLPPAPEVTDKEGSQDDQPEYRQDLRKVRAERGLRPSSSSASSSSPGKLDLRRVLGTKRQRNPTLTIKSTISDNRTGDIQQQLLQALDKGPKDCLLGLKTVSIC